MPIDASALINEIEPERTVLLFGAGSSLPSNAPSVAKLQAHFEKVFGVSAKDYNLAEQTGIIDQRTKDRQRLITELRAQFVGLRRQALRSICLFRTGRAYSLPITMN